MKHTLRTIHFSRASFGFRDNNCLVHLINCKSVRFFSSQHTFSEHNRRLANKTNASVVSANIAKKQKKVLIELVDHVRILFL